MHDHPARTLSRRAALGLLGGGVGAAALAPALGAVPRPRAGVPVEVAPPGAARADRVLFLLQPGGPAHGAATLRLHTGSATALRPSLGARAVHGRGRGSVALPGFVTLFPRLDGGGARNWSAGRLPADCQGVPLHAVGSARAALAEALDRADREAAAAARAAGAEERADALRRGAEQLLAHGPAAAARRLLRDGVRFVQWTLPAPSDGVPAGAPAALRDALDALDAVGLLPRTLLLWAHPLPAGAGPGYAAWSAGAGRGRHPRPVADAHAEVLGALGLLPALSRG